MMAVYGGVWQYMAAAGSLNHEKNEFKYPFTKVCQECGREFTAKTSVTKFCSHQCNSRHYKRGKRENFLDVISKREREQRALAVVIAKTHTGGTRKTVLPISPHSSSTNQLTRGLLDIQELAIVIGMGERSFTAYSRTAPMGQKFA